MLSFPVSWADFAAALKVARVRFAPVEQMEVTGMASGQVLRADLAPRLWRGEIALAPAYHADAAATEALLSVLASPGASFMLADPRYRGPVADPGGVMLGGAAPEILAVESTDARILSLEGLPAGYVLRRGDMLGFAYEDDAETTLHALHRIVTAETIASAEGETGWIQVVPPLQPGAEAGLAVNLINPQIKAILLEPGYGNSVPLFTDAQTFGFVQVLA